MRPTVLTLLYVLVSFSLGSWAYSKGLVYSLDNLNNYKSWQYYQLATFVMLAFNFIVFLVYTKTSSSLLRSNYSINAVERREVAARAKYLFFTTLLVSLPFAFFDVDLSVVGGSGGIAVIPKALVAISLIYYSCVRLGSSRYVIYMLILLGFSYFSFSDKRDAIFLVFPIVYLELLFNVNKINIRIILVTLALVFFIVFLIVVMSITRGYGGYDVNSVSDAIPLVKDYLMSDLFLVYFFNNIEVNYTFFHSIQAVEYILGDSSLIAYGETIVKFIFLVVPRELFESKPQSFVDLYTLMYDPSFRAKGGSWPPNFYAEIFWNFSFIGFAVAFYIFLLFETLFIKLTDRVRVANYSYSLLSLFFVYSFLILIRGGGFDLFLFQIIVSGIFTFLGYVFLRLIRGEIYAGS
ncbi:hypothetical protein [Umboniibacter marinipuniceus]|nr:hypothetical protein [Umboniibacter marinipuniceus]